MDVFPLVLVIAFVGGAPATPPALPGAIGSPLPAFTARTLDSRSVSSQDFAGMVLVLNIWATWCPPCRGETSDLIGAYRKLHAADVAFLGLDDTESPAVVTTFVAVHGVPYETVLVQPNIHNILGISVYPTTIVVDRQGIVRSRLIGPVTAPQLAEAVVAAREGRNFAPESPQQTKIDKMLAPEQFTFSGTPATIRKTVASVQKQIAAADAYNYALGDKHAASVDQQKIQVQEGALLYAAAGAMRDIASSPHDRAEADTLFARAFVDFGRYDEAMAAYEAALALQPRDTSTLLLLADMYDAEGNFQRAIQYGRLYEKDNPQDPYGYVDIGWAEQHSGRLSEARIDYQKAVSLLRSQVAAATPKERGGLAAETADESLALADIYVALGNKAAAQRTFKSAERYAEMVASNNEYFDVREEALERAAEGMVTLAVSHNGFALSLSKWTGPGLPGSLSSMYEYRLVVAGEAGRQVTLAAQNVEKGWVASFCADGVCSPGSVSVVLPQNGVKTYEFQLVPPSAGSKPGNVTVVSNGVTAALP